TQEKWREAFKQAGWDIRLDPKKPNLSPAHADEKTWTVGELQQALYIIRIQQIIENAGLDFKPPFAKRPIKEMTPNEIKKCIDDTRASPRFRKYGEAFEKNVPAFDDKKFADPKTEKQARESFQAGITKSFKCLEIMRPLEIDELLQQYLPDFSTLPDP